MSPKETARMFELEAKQDLNAAELQELQRLYHIESTEIKLRHEQDKETRRSMRLADWE